MKLTKILSLSALTGMLVFSAGCTDEKIYGLDPNGLAQAGDYKILVNVNDATNEFTLSLDHYEGIYPAWTVYGNPSKPESPSIRTTSQTVTGVIKKAGDYDVEVRIGNHNGLSDGILSEKIHIAKDLDNSNKFKGYKYDSDFNMWKTANVTLQSTWFANNDWGELSPQPVVDVTNELITFHTPADMGGSQWQGQVHIITDIQVSSEESYDFSCYIDAIIDSNVTVKVQKDGDDETFFEADVQPFNAGGSAYYFSDMKGFDGTLKIAFDFAGNPDMDFSISNIVFKNHKDDDGTVLPAGSFKGFKYDSEFNLWKTAPVALASTWFADGSWGELSPQPEVEVANDRIFVHTPSGMGNDQWQGQVHINTGIAIDATKSYDFSMWLTADVDSKVTVKPHPEGDDDTFFVADKQDFAAGGSVYYFSNKPGFDTQNLVLTLDFAGYPDTDFEITNIVLKDHANDDGTVLPSENPEGPGASQNVTWVDVNSDANIWNSANITLIDSWTSGDDWNGTTAEPQITQDSNEFTLSYSETPGGDQWKAQFKLETDLSFTEDKLYDMRVTINPSCDISQATVKPTNFTDDKFWSEGRHDLEAYEDNIISLVGVSADMPDFKIVFDFAGVQAGATVVVKDIIIQEHDATSSGGSGNSDWVGEDSDENIWKGVTPTDFFYYTADNEWAPLQNPTLTQDGNEFTLVYPQGTGNSQWQGQFHIKTNMNFSAEKSYDFRVVINPTDDLTGVTLKPTSDDDSSFWSDARHDLESYEDNVIELINVSADMENFKIVFDFPGVSAGGEIVIKDIIIQEH